MPRRSSPEGKDFNRLKELGLELEDPQDEFSYQPGSGGTHSGRQALNEDGVDVRPDSRSKRGIEEGTQARELSSEGFSTTQKAAASSGKLSNEEVLSLIQKRLDDHPLLNSDNIHLSLERNGRLVIEGSVPSASDKLRLEEMVEAIYLGKEVRNQVQVQS